MHEVILSESRIADGSGNPWFWGDIAIDGSRVTAVDRPGSLMGRRVIEVDGRFVSPGFVDVHAHSDLSLFINPQAESVVRQGVTTEIIGNCGLSPAPVGEEFFGGIKEYWGRTASQPEISWNWRSFGEYLQEIEGRRVAINIGSLVGHGAVRIAVMGLRMFDKIKKKVKMPRRIITATDKIIINLPDLLIIFVMF